MLTRGDFTKLLFCYVEIYDIMKYTRVEVNMDLIRLKNVEKKYKNGVTAIYDLNLAIEKGSFTFVIGGSGSGKSTLIKMLHLIHLQ